MDNDREVKKSLLKKASEVQPTSLQDELLGARERGIDRRSTRRAKIYNLDTEFDSTKKNKNTGIFQKPVYKLEQNDI